MLNLAVSEENYLRADSLYRKLPPPRADTLQYQFAHAYKTNNEEKKRELLAAYEKSTTFAPLVGAYTAISTAYDPEPFDHLMKIALERNNLSGESRLPAVIIASTGLIEQGRAREGLDLLRPHEAGNNLGAMNRLANSPM